MGRKLSFTEAITEVESVNSEIRKELNREMEINDWRRVIDKYWFKCNCCNEWFYKEYRRFIQKYLGKCTDCKGHIIDWNIEKVKKYCASINSEFLSDNWGNSRDKYIFKCTNCGEIITKTFAKFYNGQTKCKECILKQKSEKTRKSHAEYLIELANKNINIEPLEQYLGDNAPIKHKCPKCDRDDWLVTPSNILSKKSNACMDCRTSSGEDKISKYLIKNNILFKREYKFKNLKSNNNYPLRFDFALFNSNNDLYLLIEYDGEHHYKPARYSKNKEKMLKKLKETQRYDNIKNQFCKTNNISLLRIPYWEFDNIEIILEDILNNKGEYTWQEKLLNN